MKQNQIQNIFLFLFFLFLSSETTAQDGTYKPKAQFYGFIRNEVFYDSYKGVDAAMDQFYLVPLYAGRDANGSDINDQGSAHLTAIATRLGVTISGTEILGATPLANIETDFAGITKTEPVVLRIRKAFLKLTWKNSALLVGQTWHPFFGGADCPMVAGLNTGAPFQPFNRSPQVNYDYQTGKIILSGTALYESQYVSKGFYAVSNTNQSTLPKRNAGIPEFVFSVKYSSKKITVGVSAQYNTIQPIDVTTGSDGEKYITNEMNTSQAGMAYIQYSGEKLKILARAVIGQNLANLTMPGGYGVKSVDETTGAYTYTNYTNYTAFINGVYGKQHQVGFFAGIGENLGTNDALADASLTAGMLTKIQNMNRFSANYTYNIKNFRFIAEYERTTAVYGTGNMDLSNGLFSSSERATNNRLIFVMMYTF